MTTYPGLPGPQITPHLTRNASRASYAPGTEFAIDRISMVGNTGTYLDSPYHRYPDGTDLAGLPLSALADVPAVVIRTAGTGLRAVDVGALAAHNVTAAPCSCIPAATPTGAPPSTPTTRRTSPQPAPAGSSTAERASSASTPSTSTRRTSRRPESDPPTLSCLPPACPWSSTSPVSSSCAARGPVHRRPTPHRPFRNVPRARLRHRARARRVIVLAVDVLGWAGAAALLLGYALVTHDPATATGRRYLALNLIGSTGLAANGAAHTPGRPQPSTSSGSLSP